MKVMKVTVTRYALILRVACVMTIVALGLMAWSMLDPRPVPVLVAMSVGQAIGTLSLLMFLVVVVADLRRARLGRAPISDAPPKE